MVSGKVISRHVGSFPVGQRLTDGYVNATILCQASGKLIADYLRLDSTKAFLSKLSETMGIPIVNLIEVRMGRTGGTWAHPRVAMHLAQWCSPEFAVLVSQWVLEWLTQGSPPTKPARLPIYVQRLSLACKMQMCVPEGYWTVFDKCSNLLILVECDLGLHVDTYDLLDGSVGIRWSRFRKNEPWIKPTKQYSHIFPDKRGVRQAAAYRLEELPHFEQWLKGTYVRNHLPEYLEGKYNPGIPIKKMLARALGSFGVIEFDPKGGR